MEVTVLDRRLILLATPATRTSVFVGVALHREMCAGSSFRPTAVDLSPKSLVSKFWQSARRRG